MVRITLSIVLRLKKLRRKRSNKPTDGKNTGDINIE